MTSFNDVKIGERFYYKCGEFIKTLNSENDKKGAVNIRTGAYMTDCANWIVEVPVKSTKEKKIEQDNEIAFFTCEFDKDPLIMRITKEQKRIIEILYDYDIISYDITIDFKDDIFIVDATKE